MSFLRGAGLVILGVIFFVGLIGAGLLYTFQNSLEYDNLKNEVGSVIIENVATNQNFAPDVEEAIVYLQDYCKTHSSYVYNSAESKLNIDLSCGSIRAGKQAVIDEIVNESLREIYYQKYDCEFTECLNQDKPLYLISEEFKGYLISKIYIFLLGLIILSVLMFLLVENKSNYFFISGALIIVAGLPFLILKSAFFFLENYMYGISKIFLSNSSSTFIVFFVTGIIFLIIGIVLKLVGVGFKISHFFEKRKDGGEKSEPVSKKDVKNIVKKEISKNEIKEIVKDEISKEKKKGKNSSK